MSLKGTGLLGRQTAADPYFRLVCLPLANLETDDWPREVSRCSGRREEATDTEEIAEEDWTDGTPVHRSGIISPFIFISCEKGQKPWRTLANYLVVISSTCQVSAPHFTTLWSLRTKHSPSSNGSRCDLFILCSSNAGR